MAKEKVNRPGKPLAQVSGFKIRKTPKGEFGIYTGKYLFKAYLLFETALKVAQRLVARKPTYYSLWHEYDLWKKNR